MLRLILDMLNHTLISYWDTFKTTCRWPVSWSWNYSFCDCSCLEWGPPGHGMARLASYCTETQHWIVITSLIEKYRLWFEKKYIIQTRHGMHPQPFNFKLSATKNINSWLVEVFLKFHLIKHLFETKISSVKKTIFKPIYIQSKLQ